MKYAIIDDSTYWLHPTGSADAVRRVAKHLLSGTTNPEAFRVVGIRNGVVSNSVPLPWFCEHNGIEKEVPSWRA